MSTAFQFFLLIHLILAKVNLDLGACANFYIKKDGFFLYTENTEAAEGEGKTAVAFASTRCSTLVELPAAENPRHPQQAPFKGSYFSTSDPCGLTDHHGSKATIVEMCDLSRGDERDVSPVLEMRSRVEQLLRPILHSARPPQPVIQSAIWQTTSLGWTAMGESPVELMESAFPYEAILKSRQEKQQQRQQFMARWRPSTSWQRTWQRTGARFCTGSDGTFHALPAHDAPISTAYDAASLATTYERQGCWQRRCATASNDATKFDGPCSSGYAMGIYGADDADANNPNEFLYDARTSYDVSARWTSPTEAESIAQRDEEGGGQPSPTSPVHCSRDAEAGREEQHQDALPSSASVGGCETRITGSRECESAAAVTVEAVFAAVCREVERVLCKLPCIGDCTPARCPGSKTGCQAGSENLRPGIQEGAEWKGRHSHHLGRGSRPRWGGRCDGRPAQRECPTYPSGYGLNRHEPRGAIHLGRSAGATCQTSKNVCSRWRYFLTCAAFWQARCCMTDMYTHQGLPARLLTSPEAARLQWSHSVLSERDFLSEWQAQEHASTLATELGFSGPLRVDTISMALRRRTNRCNVRFNNDITVYIGEDSGFDLRPTTIAHSALQDFMDKPWGLRSTFSSPLEQDVISFMARRPSQLQRPTSSAGSSTSLSSSYTSSSTTRSRDWRQTVLILLDGRMFSTRLPWDDGEQLVQRICATIGNGNEAPQQQGLYGAHHVRHRPADLVQQGLECILVQTDIEPRPSTFLRLAVIDLEIFEPNEILPGAFRRFSRWLPETINRLSVFRLLGLESLLAAHPDRSRLWHNNIPVEEHQVSPLHLQDGDFLHVLIGDSVDGFLCTSTSPTSFQENMSEEDEVFSGFQFSTTTIQSTYKMIESADVDPMSNVAMCISSVDPRLCGPLAMSMNEPFYYFQSENDSPSSDRSINDFSRPPRVEQPIWQHDVWDLLRAHGETELQEEGPIVYVTSHYISHTTVTRNTVTRPLRFDTDHETWEASVRFMWEDFIDNQAQLEIFIISPDPPTTVYQGTVATVVVTQHPRPGHAACVISTYEAGQSHLQNSQAALSTALLTPSDAFIDASGARPRCPQGAECQLWIGEQALPHDADVRVHDGLGLHVIIPEEPPREDATPSPAAMMQAPTESHQEDEVTLLHVAQSVQPSLLSTTMDTSERKCVEPHMCGVDLPSNSAETNFYQQVSTTLVQPTPQWDPAAPDLFLENLVGLWELLAFAWEDEPRSGVVLVWFVDHHWHAPRCLAPRPVRLYPAFMDWRRHWASMGGWDCSWSCPGLPPCLA